jgi:hypothetical protein
LAAFLDVIVFVSSPRSQQSTCTSVLSGSRYGRTSIRACPSDVRPLPLEIEQDPFRGAALRLQCTSQPSREMRSHRFGTHRQGRIARGQLSSPETRAARFQAPFQRSSQLGAGRRRANDVRLTSRTSGRRLDCRVDTERLQEGPQCATLTDLGWSGTNVVGHIASSQNDQRKTVIHIRA